MTRINVDDPATFADQHLMAECRELPRVFGLALAALERAISDVARANPDMHPDRVRALAIDRVRASCPPAYTLGAGHVRFFYSRTGYLSRRQSAIIAECLRRGFNLTHRTAPPPVPGLDDDWTPTPEAIEINRARIAERIAARPGFYRFTAST